MKIILNPNPNPTEVDLIAMVRCAHFALSKGIEQQPPNTIMAVTLGGDPHNTYGVVRRKSGLTVYPPSTRSE